MTIEAVFFKRLAAGGRAGPGRLVSGRGTIIVPTWTEADVLSRRPTWKAIHERQ
jgi:hypothetical protein